jgi:hypothetical protein
VGRSLAPLDGARGRRTRCDRRHWAGFCRRFDGFNLAFAVRPDTFNDVVDWIVPELQRRGRYRTFYPSGVLREKLFGAGPRLRTPHPGATYRAARAA